MKHTKGEWSVMRHNDLCYTISTATQSDEYLPDEEDEANARLIENAPVMLAALRRIRGNGTKEYLTEDQIFEIAHEALLKAIGTVPLTENDRKWKCIATTPKGR